MRLLGRKAIVVEVLHFRLSQARVYAAVVGSKAYNHQRNGATEP